VRRLNSPAVRAETTALWAIAWPILIGQLATVGMGVVDVAMAGHASAQDLAGVSLGVSIWHLAIITLMGVLMAVNPIVAQHVGARSVGQIPHVVRQALWNGLGLGCGVAQGYATLGQIGFEGRWDYAAIGSVTNLAARLCSEADAGQILVDRKTMARVDALVQATPVGPMSLKGFHQPVPAFALTDLAAPA
jgi:hypothetical protein